MTEPNNGAFYIPAEDVDSINSFSVPGDKAGETPDGTDNPSQPSFDVDDKQKQYAKVYYIYIRNGWDVNTTFRVRGSHYSDRDMTEAVIENPTQNLNSGEVCVIEDTTGHSYMDVVVNGLTEIPSTGTLKVIFQTRYR